MRSPACRVVGVEPELAHDAGRSWQEGQIFKLDAVPQTIADGLRTRAIGGRNLEIMQRYVSDMTSVSELSILDALKFIWERLKIVVEPSSAVALAPILSGQYSIPSGARVGILLSGGNIDMSVFDLLIKFPNETAATPLPSKEVVKVSNRRAVRKPSRILVCAPIAPQALEILQRAGEVVA